MKPLKAVGAAAAAVAFTFAMSPQASAADYSMHSLGDVSMPWEDYGGLAYFTKNGDIVKVCDGDADGRAATLKVESTRTAEGYRIRAGGDGVCTTVRASMGGKYDLKEGDTYEFLLCLNDGTDGYCNRQYWKNNG